MAKLNWRGHRITTFNNTHSIGSKENRRQGLCKNVTNYSETYTHEALLQLSQSYIVQFYMMGGV